MNTGGGTRVGLCSSWQHWVQPLAVIRRERVSYGWQWPLITVSRLSTSFFGLIQVSLPVPSLSCRHHRPRVVSSSLSAQYICVCVSTASEVAACSSSLPYEATRWCILTYSRLVDLSPVVRKATSAEDQYHYSWWWWYVVHCHYGLGTQKREPCRRRSLGGRLSSKPRRARRRSTLTLLHDPHCCWPYRDQIGTLGAMQSKEYQQHWTLDNYSLISKSKVQSPQLLTSWYFRLSTSAY